MAQAPWKPVKRWKKLIGQGRIVKTAEEMKAEIQAELAAAEAAKREQEEIPQEEIPQEEGKARDKAQGEV